MNPLYTVRREADITNVTGEADSENYLNHSGQTFHNIDGWIYHEISIQCAIYTARPKYKHFFRGPKFKAKIGIFDVSNFHFTCLFERKNKWKMCLLIFPIEMGITVCIYIIFDIECSEPVLPFSIFLFQVVFRLIVEVTFMVVQFNTYIYKFSVPELFKCSRWPCPNVVDCFISRPKEKTIFLWIMFGRLMLLRYIVYSVGAW